jgi:hypothetical protein
MCVKYRILFVFGLCAGMPLCNLRAQDYMKEKVFDVVCDNGNQRNIALRLIDTKNLEPRDKKNLLTLSGDYEMLATMFGRLNAAAIKFVHFTSPDTILNMLHTSEENKYEKMPDDQKHLYHWIIEEATSKQCIGDLSVSTYTDNRPPKYGNSLLIEIGLVLNAAYRNQKLASTFAPHVVKWLNDYQPFKEAIFCFNTLPSHTHVRRLAQKLHCECILSHQYELDFGLYKEKVGAKLFILPKNNQAL